MSPVAVCGPFNSQFISDNHFECSICLDTLKDPNVILLNAYIAFVILVSRRAFKDAVLSVLRAECRARIISRRDLRKDQL